TLDPTLLAELLGQAGSAQLADLLDPDVVVRTEAELTGTAPERRARHAEDLADVLRRHGPLTDAELRERVRPEHAREATAWASELERARRAIRVRHGERTWWAAVEDAGRLRDAFGVALPVGVPEDFTEQIGRASCRKGCSPRRSACHPSRRLVERARRGCAGRS